MVTDGLVKSFIPAVPFFSCPSTDSPSFYLQSLVDQAQKSNLTGLAIPVAGTGRGSRFQLHLGSKKQYVQLYCGTYYLLSR